MMMLLAKKLSFRNLRRGLGSVFFETSVSNVRIVKLGVNLSFSNILYFSKKDNNWESYKLSELLLQNSKDIPSVEFIFFFITYLLPFNSVIVTYHCICENFASNFAIALNSKFERMPFLDSCNIESFFP